MFCLQIRKKMLVTIRGTKTTRVETKKGAVTTRGVATKQTAVMKRKVAT